MRALRRAGGPDDTSLLVEEKRAEARLAGAQRQRHCPAARHQGAQRLHAPPLPQEHGPVLQSLHQPHRHGRGELAGICVRADCFSNVEKLKIRYWKARGSRYLTKQNGHLYVTLTLARTRYQL